MNSLSIVFILLNLSASSGPEPLPFGKVHFKLGDVQFSRAGSKLSPVKDDQVLLYGDSLKVGKNGRLTLKRASGALVQFGPNPEPQAIVYRPSAQSEDIKRLMDIAGIAGQKGDGKIKWPGPGTCAKLFAIEIDSDATKVHVYIEQAGVGVFCDRELTRSPDGLFRSPEVSERLVRDAYPETPVVIRVGKVRATFTLMSEESERRLLEELKDADHDPVPEEAALKRAMAFKRFNQIPLAQAELRRLGWTKPPTKKD